MKRLPMGAMAVALAASMAFAAPAAGGDRGGVIIRGNDRGGGLPSRVIIRSTSVEEAPVAAHRGLVVARRPPARAASIPAHGNGPRVIGHSRGRDAAPCVAPRRPSERHHVHRPRREPTIVITRYENQRITVTAVTPEPRRGSTTGPAPRRGGFVAR